MSNGPFGTGFAQSGFSYDPNLSPGNQGFALAVLAVVRRAGLGTGGGGGGGTGSVTSVGLADASTTPIYLITNSPITTSGNLTLTLGTQVKNTVFAGPRSGANAQPAFRTIALGTDLSDVTITAPAIRQPLQWDGTAHWVNGTNYQPLFQRGASFSGGVGAISVPTNNAAIYIPEDCNIIGVEVLTAGGTGSCVLDIWRTPFASYPPTSGNSITASAKPTITGGLTYRDTTLTGWSTALSAGDTLLVNLTSCSVFTYVMLVLTMQPVGSTTYNGYTNAQAIAAVAGQLANPTNKVSGTATNGTSTFFMRADAAPALDWAQGPTWTGTHVHSPTSGTPITVNAPSGTPGVVVTSPSPSQGLTPAMLLTSTNTAGFYGLQIQSLGTFAALSIGGTKGTIGTTDVEIIQSGPNAAIYNGANGTFGWYTNQILGLQLAPGNIAVLGTGTAYAWGTGTNYPIMQYAGIGAIFGTGTGNIVCVGGGGYWNGTAYIQGQAGTSAGWAVGNGTFAVSVFTTSGTAGQAIAAQNVFVVGGTLAAYKITGYGPAAAALVDFTPDRTTYITTLAQGAANLHGTATIARVGSVVHLWVPIITGTAAGGTTTSVLTIPMAAAFQNSGTLFQLASVNGNGTEAIGGVAYSGTTFTLTPTLFSGTFTGTLNRGLPRGLLMSWPTT